MLAVLTVVELSDVIFAIDSIPAIFGVTREPYVVYSATALALIGLRSMYFLGCRRATVSTCVLFTLDPQEAPMSIGDVAEAIGISVDDAAQALHELRSRGYASEEDRRYEPTEKGERLLASLAGRAPRCAGDVPLELERGGATPVRRDSRKSALSFRCSYNPGVCRDGSADARSSREGGARASSGAGVDSGC